jgi:hypothetical protein
VILPARAPLWRLLAGLAEDAWHDAIEMNDAQGAVALYCPDGLSGTSRGHSSHLGWRPKLRISRGGIENAW